MTAPVCDNCDMLRAQGEDLQQQFTLARCRADSAEAYVKVLEDKLSQQHRDLNDERTRLKLLGDSVNSLARYEIECVVKVLDRLAHQWAHRAAQSPIAPM